MRERLPCYLPKDTVLSGQMMKCARCGTEIPIEEANADDWCIICQDLAKLWDSMNKNQRHLPTMDPSGFSSLPPSDR